MKRAVFVVVLACLTLTLLTGVALAAKPAVKFPAGANVKVTSVPPFFHTFSWTAATGAFDTYRLDLVKKKGAAATYRFDTGKATRFTVETVSGEGYPYCQPGVYGVSVSALVKGKVAATLALKGTVTLK
jgi:hypothetical protein